MLLPLPNIGKHLDVRLFDKSPNGYQLTDAGLRLLPLAEEIETASNRLYQDIAGKDGLVKLFEDAEFGFTRAGNLYFEPRGAAALAEMGPAALPALFKGLPLAACIYQQ